MSPNPDLNRFELDILDYVYRNPAALQQTAIERNNVDLGCGMIAVHLLARRGLVAVDRGAGNRRFLTITASGIDMLRHYGLARQPKPALISVPRFGSALLTALTSPR